MTAKVLAIIIGVAPGEALHSVKSAHAVPGSGLEGDRYYTNQGTYSNHPGDGRDLTLIESESLEALAAEAGIHLDLRQSRRNLVTQGIRLNPLVGRTFRIGTVTARGVRLCNPCQHLEDLTQSGVLSGLVQRGGLRADILTPGVIHAGDPIELLDE
jgi:MOSC domain-containing protein YiiM